jgi:hypothetical protein
MQVSESALEAIRDEAFEEGYKRARKDADFESRMMVAQFKKLSEILELEGDQNLIDGIENMAAQCRAHKEANRVICENLDAARAQIVELRAQAAQMERVSVETRLWADKQHAADQEYIAQVQAAIEPKQEEIHRLNIVANRQREQIDELRQSLLQHIKETA